MMVSSPPEQPPQVAALSLMAELVALLKGADGTLTDRVAELRAYEESLVQSHAAFTAAESEHQARATALDQRSPELDTRAAELERREVACRDGAEKTGRMQATFDAQAKALADREAALAARTEEQVKAAADWTAACQADRAAIETARKAASDEAARTKQAAEAAAQEIRAAAKEEARGIRAAAEADVAQLRQGLDAREQQIAQREQAFN